jgi:hypothetical protein
MREFYSLSLTIAFSLVTAEDNPDDEIVEKLNYIKDNTHTKLNMPLTTTEMIILRNLGSPFSKTIEIRDNTNSVRELPLYTIIRYAKESSFEIARCVVKIAKKYSLDIPMRPSTGAIDIPTVPEMLNMNNQPVQNIPLSDKTRN